MAKIFPTALALSPGGDQGSTRHCLALEGQSLSPFPLGQSDWHWPHSLEFHSQPITGQAPTGPFCLMSGRPCVMDCFACQEVPKDIAADQLGSHPWTCGYLLSL